MDVTINANYNQLQQLYEKHLRFPVVDSKFYHDDRQGESFFSCKSLLGCSFLCRIVAGSAINIECVIRNIEYRAEDPTICPDFSIRLNELWRATYEQFRKNYLV